MITSVNIAGIDSFFTSMLAAIIYQRPPYVNNLPGTICPQFSQIPKIHKPDIDKEADPPYNNA